jgi:hypothetical protein
VSIDTHVSESFRAATGLERELVVGPIVSMIVVNFGVYWTRFGGVMVYEVKRCALDRAPGVVWQFGGVNK